MGDARGMDVDKESKFCCYTPNIYINSWSTIPKFTKYDTQTSIQTIQIQA
jgi:hypothetical protein